MTRLSALDKNGIRKVSFRIIEIMTAIIRQKSIFVAKELKIVQKAYETGYEKVTGVPRSKRTSFIYPPSLELPDYYFLR